jgi:hypothetical protein
MASIETNMREGVINTFLVGAAKLIEKGNPVYTKTATGLAFQPSSTDNVAAGDLFVGIAVETIDNTTGAAGAVSVRVYGAGVHQVPNTGSITQTSVGKAIKITNAGVLAAGTPATRIGTCVGVTTALVDISIDGAIGSVYA